MNCHDFNERLNYSEQAGHEDFWNAIYEKAFPSMVFHKLCTGNCQGQFLGIDRVIQLSSGKTLYIDEKKREQEYGDILLEYISVDTTGAKGWIEKDLQIDYLAYAFMQSKRCYLLPWQLLKRVWRHYGQEWIKKYPKIEAQNKTYKTISVAIPIPILINTLKNAMIIQL